jgi:hypothetical protein
MPGIQQSQNPNTSPLSYLNSNGSVTSNVREQLINFGSEYSYGNTGVATPFDPGFNRQNPLSTKQSTLHARSDGNYGYSLDGAEMPINGTPLVDAASQYLDGNPINDLPTPSTLDLNTQNPTSGFQPQLEQSLQTATLDLDGSIPTFAGHGLTPNPNIHYMNNQLPYDDNMPPGGVI